jgi:hypothetical protein
MDDKTCYNCNETGHISPICPHPKQDDDSGEETEGDKKKKTAASKNKTAKDKASKKKKAAKTTAKKTSFAMQEQEDDDEESSDSEESILCNVDITDALKKKGGPKSILKKRGGGKLNLREMWLLDNQSTTDLFCNKRFVTNIRPAKGQVTVKGNGGTLTTKLKADVKGYGEVWFCEQAITNILSMANLTKKFRVTYDSAQDGAFIVHTPK